MGGELKMGTRYFEGQLAEDLQLQSRDDHNDVSISCSQEVG